jgi:hypothetical protein
VSAAPPPGPRRGPLVAAAVIGVGLVLAPVAFQMFTRAPKGGTMLDEFRPFMTAGKVEAFRGHMAEIDRAEREVRATVRPLVAQRLRTSEAEVERRFPELAELHRRWPGINADMGEMLDTMAADLDNFAAVDALPPFPLFPWFFVIPGVLAAALAATAWRGRGRGSLWALAALGVGLVAAPAVFQMFTRAPKGGEMINDFRPLMTAEKVASVQRYFLTIGAAEGELRTEVLPALAGPGQPSPALPAVAAFQRDWPRISNEMAPMIGAMSDNLDNFAAVDALPPFPLFPWFFVAPGVLLALLAAASARRSPALAPVVVPSAQPPLSQRSGTP